MEFKTKYKPGNHIWIVYIREGAGELSIYDDYIDSISIDKKGMYYVTKEGYLELKEEEIILYDDKKTLYDKITKEMKLIRQKEKEKTNEK